MNDDVPPLILAAEAGDVQQVKALLATGCDVDAHDPRSETRAQAPLMRQ